MNHKKNGVAGMSDKKTEEKLSVVEKVNRYINNKSKRWKIVVGVISIIALILFAAGTFAFPFIKFSSKYNTLMICIWSIMSILFFGIVTLLFILDKWNNKNEVEKLKKDKFIYIYSHGLTVVVFAITLLLSFLNNSFNCKFNILNILFFSAIGFFIIGFIISSFINDKKKFFKVTGKSIILLFAVFCILSGFYQIEPANEIEKTTRIARMILIVGGFSIVIVMACLTISNWISDVAKKNKSFNTLFAITLFVGCIILSTIIILNLPYDEKVIGNIVAVFAGVVGGVLTLVGVLMEIRHQEKVRKEEKLERDIENKNQRIREITPIMGVYNVFQEGDKVKSFNYYVDSSYVISNFLFVACVKNTDKIGFLVEGIEVNNKLYQNVNNDEYIDKNTMFAIKLYSDKYFVIDSCYLLVKDIDLNKHRYKIEFNNKGNFLRAISIREVPND